MKVSLNWVKNFTDVNLPIKELVEKIGVQLGAVESVVDLGKRYQGIVVVEVLTSEKHPDADKLTVCKVSDAGVVKDVQRESDGHVQIVCGAPNVKTGMLVAWIPPGVIVPSTVNKDPFKIEVKEIRGIISNGMLASPKELDMGDYHEGLLVVDEDAKPGQSFAEVYKLDDYIIDIENKMFTHRPDCFGMLGVARELAGIQGQAFKSPEWYSQDAKVPNPKGELKLEVQNEVQNLAPRFCVVAMSDVEVKPSPIWLQSKLNRVGIRPINNIVDITNFYMLETAQPLHAYDYDKVKTGVLGVRLSKDSETLKLIGGKQLKLEEGAVVITDGEKPIGLGGVMGGADTEVDANTKNIILECGTFDMNATRKTAMKYGLFTDAATRFTKGQSPLQNVAVISYTAEDIIRIAGGNVASGLIDAKGSLPELSYVQTSAEFINNRLGLELSLEQMKKLLENVEFKVQVEGEQLSITVPFWRTDIEIPEDIVEEIGRLYGYDHLPTVLPGRDLKAAKVDSLLSFKARLRGILSSAGANEVLTYSFVHGSLLEKVGQDPGDAYQLRNALSPDLQYYRLSLMPSLLEKVHPNIKQGYDKLILFEIGKAHNKLHSEDGEERVPKEFNMLAGVVAAKDGAMPKDSGAAFYQAKAYLDFLASKLGITFRYEMLESAPDYPVAKPYEYRRSAAVSVAETGAGIGMVGEFRQEVVRNLKLTSYAAGFEIGIEELLASLPTQPAYQSLPRYPEVEQDITLLVSAEIGYGALYEKAKEILENIRPHATIYTFEPLDIYQKAQAAKHFSFRLSISSYDKTLRTEEINSLLDELAGKLKDKMGTERV